MLLINIMLTANYLPPQFSFHQNFKSCIVLETQIGLLWLIYLIRICNKNRHKRRKKSNWEVDADLSLTVSDCVVN